MSAIVGLEEWKKTVEYSDQYNPYVHLNGIVTPGIGRYFQPVVSGYMVAPVALHNRAVIEARSEKVADINEFRAKLENLDQKSYFYNAVYLPPVPKVDGAHVEMSEPTWIVRYGLGN